MRPSDVPDLRRGGRRRPRHHRQGRACSSRPTASSTSSLDLGFGRCRMVLAARRRRRQPRRGRAPARHDADRDQVPADRRALLRADRPPGRGHRGQGLGRARAAGRPRRRHRRPRRHRPHPRRRTTSRSARRSSICTARLVANRVAHKLRVGRDRRTCVAAARARRSDEDRRGSTGTARARSRSSAAASRDGPDARERRRRGRGDHRRGARRRRRRRCVDLASGSTTPAPERLRVDAEASPPRRACSSPSVARGARVAAREHRGRRRGPARRARADRRSSSPQGQRITVRERAGRPPPASTRPAGAAPTPRAC